MSTNVDSNMENSQNSSESSSSDSESDCDYNECNDQTCQNDNKHW